LRQESSKNFTSNSSSSAGYTTPEERERGERFLAAYHSVEQLMRRMSGNDSRESFRHLVDEMSKENAVVRRYRDDLIEFSELRNAIVHERVSPDYLIAVPLRETVERIEEIARLLSDPPLVYPRFQREVVVFSPQDPLEKVFQTIYRKGFTQFPVYEDGVYMGLLTDRGIARWVAGLMSGGIGKDLVGEILASALVGEVLVSEKNPYIAKFVGKRFTVFEVEDLFRESSRRERSRIAAVLITENGNPDEELLGIITPTDLLSSST